MSSRPSRLTSPQQTPHDVSSRDGGNFQPKSAWLFGASLNRPLPSLRNSRLPPSRPPRNRSGHPSLLTSHAMTPKPVTLSGRPTRVVTSSNLKLPRLRNSLDRD